ADGTIEAAEVRDGDPAPDGSGPLRLTRGMEMGHIFQLGRKYAEALGLTVLDENGKTAVVTMGSYGIGVTRAVAAVAELYHDEKGLAWPRQLAPADVHIVATGKGQEVFEEAERIAAELEARGAEVRAPASAGDSASTRVGPSCGSVPPVRSARAARRRSSPRCSPRSAAPDPAPHGGAAAPGRHPCAGGGFSTSSLGSGSIRSTSAA